jgi:hypothetical protein
MTKVVALSILLLVWSICFIAYMTDAFFAALIGTASIVIGYAVVCAVKGWRMIGRRTRWMEDF